MSGQIHEYIKKQRDAGVSDGAIKEALIVTGWKEQDVESALLPNTDTKYSDIYNGRLLSPLDLLKRSWNIFTERIWTIVRIQIVPLLGLLGLSLFVLLAVLIAKIVGETGTIVVAIVGVLIGLGIFGYIIYLSLWSQVAVVIAIRDSAEKISAKEAFNRAKGKLGVFFVATLLTGLVILGGYILLIIPGILFAVWFMFSGYVAIDEGKSGGDALSQSREYARGLWWEIAARVMFISLVSLSLSSIGSLVSIINPTIGSIASILVSIGVLLISPLFMIYPFELYRNIKTLKVNNVQITKESGKLFMLVVGELALFMVLYGVSFYFDVYPKIQEEIKSTKESILDESDIDSYKTTNKFSSPTKILQNARNVARSTDLKALKSRLIEYYSENGEYPTSLDGLVPEYFGELPFDPISGDPYSYIVLGKKSFKVCAEFEGEISEIKCLEENGEQVKGIYTVASDKFSIANFLPISPDFRSYLKLVEDLKR